MVRKVSKTSKAKGVIKRAMKNSATGPKTPKKAPKPVKDSEDDNEYEVESIQGTKTENEKLFYQVKWKGYKKLSWEPERNLEGCQKLVEEFLKKKNSGSKSRSKKRS